MHDLDKVHDAHAPDVFVIENTFVISCPQCGGPTTAGYLLSTSQSGSFLLWLSS